MSFIEKAAVNRDAKKKTPAAAGDDKSDNEDDEDESAAVGGGITADMKYEFIDKVKKLTNEGLTQMVQHI